MTDKQSRFKERLAKLIEISNEMALNADDGAFARGREDGEGAPEIFYVYDEALFEFFINPDRIRRKYPAFFHLEAWRDEGVNEESYWILVNEMLSILTAEYLFSGTLPGQRDDRLYMTQGHRYEVGKSYSALIEKAQPGAGSAARRRSARKRAMSRLESVAGDDASDLKLSPDLDGVPPQDHESFLRARRLARTFAEEKDNLVIDQLRRFSRDIWPKVHDLERQFPMTRADLTLIETEAKAWEGRFAEFLADRPKERRPRRNFRRDAHTLAIVQHIARRHLDSDERIVLVTGDRLMLEVYWLWYSDVFIQAPWEPNIIRSVGRFSPAVNVDDMLGGKREGVAPFELMQVALNLAIQPWKLTAHDNLGAARSQSGAPKVDPQKVANLWYFRRQILDSVNDHAIFKGPFFENSLTDDRVDDSDIEFAKIRDLYQTFERNASRAGLDLLERRRKVVLAMHEPEDEEGGDEASAMDYFRRLTENLVNENARLWLPIARTFLDPKGTSDRPDTYYRPPIILRLTVGDRTESLVDLERRLWRSSTGDRGDDELPPHLIFTLGVLFALRHRHWSDAELYAGLAKVAFRTVGVDGEGRANDEPDYQELRYLRAVCARMTMGDLKKNLQNGHGDLRSSHDIWAPHYRRAEANLRDCIAFHRQQGQPLREARALSERASARLFYATRQFVHRPAFQPPDMPSLGVTVTLEAADDLLAAFDLLAREETGQLDDDRRMMQTGVKRQVLVNLAAIDGFCRRLPDLTPHLADLENKLAGPLEAAAQWMPGQPAAEFPYVVRQEFIDFMTRRGLVAPASWKAPGEVRLDIDREILRIFRRPVIQ